MSNFLLLLLASRVWHPPHDSKVVSPGSSKHLSLACHSSGGRVKGRVPTAISRHMGASAGCIGKPRHRTVGFLVSCLRPVLTVCCTLLVWEYDVVGRILLTWVLAEARVASSDII